MLQHKLVTVKIRVNFSRSNFIFNVVSHSSLYILLCYFITTKHLICNDRWKRKCISFHPLNSEHLDYNIFLFIAYIQTERVLRFISENAKVWWTLHQPLWHFEEEEKGSVVGNETITRTLDYYNDASPCQEFQCARGLIKIMAKNIEISV